MFVYGIILRMQGKICRETVNIAQNMIPDEECLMKGSKEEGRG